MNNNRQKLYDSLVKLEQELSSLNTAKKHIEEFREKARSVVLQFGTISDLNKEYQLEIKKEFTKTIQNLQQNHQAQLTELTKKWKAELAKIDMVTAKKVGHIQKVIMDFEKEVDQISTKQKGHLSELKKEWQNELKNLTRVTSNLKQENNRLLQINDNAKSNLSAYDQQIQGIIFSFQTNLDTLKNNFQQDREKLLEDVVCQIDEQVELSKKYLVDKKIIFNNFLKSYENKVNDLISDSRKNNEKNQNILDSINAIELPQKVEQLQQRIMILLVLVGLAVFLGIINLFF